VRPECMDAGTPVIIINFGEEPRKQRENRKWILWKNQESRGGEMEKKRGARRKAYCRAFLCRRKKGGNVCRYATSSHQRGVHGGGWPNASIVLSVWVGGVGGETSVNGMGA